MPLVLHLLAWPLLALWLLAAAGRWLSRADPELRLEPLGPEPLPTPAPRVSIVVPARNEGANIEACIASLLAQDLAPHEILVVDDRSEDETAALARRAGGERVRVLAGAGPPAGWAGKPAACQRGAEAATGDWLLFVDADVRLAPWALRRSVARASARSLDLLSLWGRWVLATPWEHVLIPAIGGLIRLAHPLDAVNDPSSPLAFANGQYLLLRSTAYWAERGHERVRSVVLEDVALARALKAEGRRVGLFLAPDAFQVRLYRSFGEIWQGFSKNLYAGLGHSPQRALLGVLGLAFLHGGPSLVLAWGLSAGLPGAPLAAAGGLALACQILTRLRDDRDYGLRSWPWALSHPVGNLLTAALLANSALRHHLGATVRWKGRAVRP